MSTRAKDIFEAVKNFDADTAYHYVWMAQCSEGERAEALRLLDGHYAGRST